MFKKLFALAAVVWLLASAPAAEAKTMLYVPADDRPVSLEYAVDTVKAADFDILTPPAEYLAGRNRKGDPDKLWEWLSEHVAQADAIIVSADSLIYGGLVDSRMHNFASYALEWRVKRFENLKKANPSARLYVFNTIMRTPKASVGDVEPWYYEKYGSEIFLITALQDKAELKGLSADEQKRLETAIKAVPADLFEDWMNRRAKNFKVNEELIRLAKNGQFSYLLIGRDDTAPYSQSHKEGLAISKLATGLPVSKFTTFPGADQLGMVLLARAYNDLTLQIPIVQVEYAFGAGGATVPSYEDQPTSHTINDHIIAAGGIVMVKPQKPDLILAVNTPVNGVTLEAEAIENTTFASFSTRQFVDKVARQITAGQKVAVADIAFANGADNALMHEMTERRLLGELSSYSGWNTASNTLGFAIGQGMMAGAMDDNERQRLLVVRYLDDWAYQANIRGQLYHEVIYPNNGSLIYLDELKPLLTEKADKKIALFAKRHLAGLPADKLKVEFPWNRMFELTIQVQP
ncbi:hypothetical protein SDC9_04059 [bioreactor metagenome]|uniref:DUF4127 family protein n=1 Tax=bioreactor metagenome TaxID=1076179 RepID=A0A644SV69_9ZZZZ|nr:DUF4127 family protein [Negativicutes bacterium]